MNWRLAGHHKKVAAQDIEIDHAEDEDPGKAKPTPGLVEAARTAADQLANELGGNVHVEIHGHETTKGRGFRPGHVIITASKVDPKAKT